ncbi:MAG: YceI family protein, partial [Myxococcota bacterium]|nr:YceI family protein [Myxococcota bacterium]
RRWNIDVSHSAIEFSVRHLMISKVRGRFSSWSGWFELDEARPDQVQVQVRIEAASVDTREAQRDAHLRSADFLDVERFPTIEYRAGRLEPAGTDRYRLHGELTVRGCTRPVVLEVERTGQVRDPWGNDRIAFAARASLDRKEFGVTWNMVLDAGGVVVGDRVDVEIEVEAVAAKETAS